MSKLTYLLDLFSQIEYRPYLATTPNNYDREYNIYYIDTDKDLTSYWVTTWNGFFDTPGTAEVKAFFDVFLIEVFNSSDLESNVNSFYISGTEIYFNLPKKPWQYFKEFTSLYSAENGHFSSNVGDSSNPSDWTFSGSTNKYKPRLSVPSINNKFSNPIADLSLQQQYTFSILNNDGELDDIENTNYYNIPIELKKSTENTPAISDFDIIYKGFVESLKVSYKDFQIQTVDFNKLLTRKVTGTLTTLDYPNLPSENVDKSIPIAYGNIEKAPLILVEDGGSYFDYIVIDPGDVDSVSAVYDSDGNSVSFTNNSGIIRTTTEAVTADFIGILFDNPGDIIVNLIDTYSDLKYITSVWDVTETDNYINVISTGTKIGFYFSEGNLKTAVNEVLKNDNAFLITKNNGLLSIRRWGETYTTHNLDTWQLVNENNLKKDSTFIAKYYQSSVLVNYDKREDTGAFQGTYLYDAKESINFSTYKRSKTQIYDTILKTESNAEDLAERLENRFGNMDPDITIETSENTASIELLDTVIIQITPNGRLFTDFEGFIVKEINPSQDRIVLEPIEGYKIEKALIDGSDQAVLDENDFAIMGV